MRPRVTGCSIVFCDTGYTIKWVRLFKEWTFCLFNGEKKTRHIWDGVVEPESLEFDSESAGRHGVHSAKVGTRHELRNVMVKQEMNSTSSSFTFQCLT